MKTTGVSQISITTTSEGEEPIAALLERIFGVLPSIYANAETGESTITAFVRAKPSEVNARRADVETGLQGLKDLGLEIGSCTLRVARVRREDWSESWKKFFKVITIESSLIIKPRWAKVKPTRGQAVVGLDPGLSFGTGQHATTSFCLRQIVRAAKRGSVRDGGGSVLDVGCGSGILAIAAAKLGFDSVVAFDFDPIAVRVAKRNCQTNRVEKKVAVSRKDLTKVPLNSRVKYDVVCANLMAPLLIAERDRILNRLAPGGTLVLAGILATEFGSVRERYETAGLNLIATKKEREWESGAFRRNL